jgi:AcrR family transcriptional regulator
MTVVKKEDVVEAALELISRKGYLKTSMKEIAKAVGLTKGGLYHHVEKKEDILLLIHNQMNDAFFDAFKNSVATKTEPHKKLLKWIEVHIKLMRDYQPHIKIFFTELDNITESASFKHIVKKRDATFNLLYDLIKEGIEAKEFRPDINPELVTMLIFGMLNWFYQWYRPQGEHSVKAIIEDVEKVICEGILNKKSGKGE